MNTNKLNEIDELIKMGDTYATSLQSVDCERMRKYCIDGVHDFIDTYKKVLEIVSQNLTKIGRVSYRNSSDYLIGSEKDGGEVTIHGTYIKRIANSAHWQEFYSDPMPQFQETIVKYKNATYSCIDWEKQCKLVDSLKEFGEIMVEAVKIGAKNYKEKKQEELDMCVQSSSKEYQKIAV